MRTRELTAQLSVRLSRRRAASLLRGLGRFARAKPLGAVGGAIVALTLLMAVLADVIAPYGMNETNLRDRLAPPSARHWFGADEIGRDVFSRVVYGARISMYVGLGAVLLGISAATVLGAVSGYFGGKLDLFLQRLVDAWMSIPGLVVVLVVMSLIGPGLWNVIFALALGQAFVQSRVVRSAALTVTEQQYIEAARALGATDLRVLGRHVLPNIGAPVLIVATNALAFVILAEAAVSFLGFGVPPPEPSWGGMLSGTGRQYMERAIWMALGPGVALSLAVFGFNMLGDALRDVLDPRLRGSR